MKIISLFVGIAIVCVILFSLTIEKEPSNWYGVYMPSECLGCQKTGSVSNLEFGYSIVEINKLSSLTHCQLWAEGIYNMRTHLNVDISRDRIMCGQNCSWHAYNNGVDKELVCTSDIYKYSTKP